MKTKKKAVLKLEGFTKNEIDSNVKRDKQKGSRGKGGVCMINKGWK